MSITYMPHYKVYSINTNEEKEYGCYTKILDRYIDHLEYMVFTYRRVLQIRFDLHYPKDNSFTPNRIHISIFRRNFLRSLKRKRTLYYLDPQLITVIEQSTSIHPHYHCLLLVNGDARRKYYPIIQEAERIWKNVIKSDQCGLVDYCRRYENGIMLDKNTIDYSERINDVVYQASYIAKISTKEHRHKGSWLVQSSRIKRIKPKYV